MPRNDGRSEGKGSRRPLIFWDSPTSVGPNHKTGKFTVLRKTIGKRMAAKLKELRVKLRQRMHTSAQDTGKWLAQVVGGYFQYHAIPGNLARLKAYRNEVLRMWLQTLRQRRQR